MSYLVTYELFETLMCCYPSPPQARKPATPWICMLTIIMEKTFFFNQSIAGHTLF